MDKVSLNAKYKALEKHYKEALSELTETRNQLDFLERKVISISNEMTDILNDIVKED